jgi:Na+/melibiose symporter-like transporter
LDDTDIPTVSVTKQHKSFLKTAPSTLALCRYPTLRKNCIICGTIYSINNYVYYGSIFGLEALKGSIYFNSIFSALADIVGYFLVSITLAKIRRRVVFSVTLTLIMLASLAFYFIVIPDPCADDESDFCW